MQKYVEIKRDGLTLRGMLHIPNDVVSQKVPMVILLHGFCDDRNEINFVHNELSLRLCDAGTGRLATFSATSPKRALTAYLF